jgi:hypothetical protein
LGGKLPPPIGKRSKTAFGTTRSAFSQETGGILDLLVAMGEGVYDHGK